MDWSNDRKINAGFALALALLIVIGVVSSLSINRLIDTIRLLTYSHAVIDTLEDLFSHLKDAQRGERGFVLTGEERYLDPYHEALATQTVLFSVNSSSLTVSDGLFRHPRVP